MSDQQQAEQPDAQVSNKRTEAERKKLIAKERKLTSAYIGGAEFSETQKQLMRNDIAKGLTDDEFKNYLYMSRKYGLDPVAGEIIPTVYNKDDKYKRKVTLVVTRNGMMNVAHRSGYLGAINSGTEKVQDPETKKWETIGWAIVENKSFSMPVLVRVYLSEYMPEENEKSRKPLWWTKPRTMIAKVAEAQALRKAFNVSGVYEIEELDRQFIEGEVADTKTKEGIQAMIDRRAGGLSLLKDRNQPINVLDEGY
jgi:phage recombination protein Bet